MKFPFRYGLLEIPRLPLTRCGEHCTGAPRFITPRFIAFSRYYICLQIEGSNEG